MTAPVPPDANGLREALEALADEWEGPGPKVQGTPEDAAAVLRALLCDYPDTFDASTDASEGLSEAECTRLANFLDFYNRGAESISGLVEEVAGIKSAAATRAGERIARAIEEERSRRWQKHLRDHPYSDGASCPRDYAEHDALHAAASIAHSDAAPHTGEQS